MFLVSASHLTSDQLVADGRPVRLQAGSLEHGSGQYHAEERISTEQSNRQTYLPADKFLPNSHVLLFPGSEEMCLAALAWTHQHDRDLNLRNAVDCLYDLARIS